MKFQENNDAIIENKTDIEPQVMELAQCNATAQGKEVDDLQIAIDMQKEKLKKMKE